MEASSLNLKHGDSEMALKGLFEAFGSTFSLQEITSAYHKADQNADLAVEILSDKHGSSSTLSLSASSGEPMIQESLKLSYGDMYVKSDHANGKLRASKQKCRPISGGSVSSIIGKDYVKPVPVGNSCMRDKPIKLDAKEWPVSAIWGEETDLKPSKNGIMRKDMEDFLFRMLGDGFQLEKHVINEALEKCGYDMQKSMDELLDFSAANLNNGDKQLSKCTEKTVDVHSNSEQLSSQKLLPPLNSYGLGKNGIPSSNGGRVPQQEESNGMGKEVLFALFRAADRPEAPTRRERATRRRRASGEVVVEPLREPIIERKAVSVCLEQDEDKDEEDAYEGLRRAVKEYRTTMKEYFKAAVNAFAKGDYDRANRLMDEGHFFNEKARKADEESHQKIFQTKHADTQDEVILDLHEHGAKDAIHLLKHHLCSLSGIESIKYLKVIIETDEEDTSKGARRKWVKKLLEKESIEWIEGVDAGTIRIRADNINRRSLSFAKS